MTDAVLVEPAGDGITQITLNRPERLNAMNHALVAGLHAGLTYNTWPSMDGRVVPEGALVLQPWWSNFFENAGLAQFDHRLAAYLIAAAVLAFWIFVRKSTVSPGLRSSSTMLLAIVCLQVALGIVTLLNQAPLALAALHQATAVALFAAALWNALEAQHANARAQNPSPEIC